MIATLLAEAEQMDWPTATVLIVSLLVGGFVVWMIGRD